MFVRFGDVKLVNMQEIPLNQMGRLSVNYVSENIYIHEASGDSLVLKEYFNQSDPEMFARVFVDEDSLTIRHGERRKLFNILSGYVELYLPKSFFGTLNVKSISGKIQADARLRLSELNLSNTSGRIELDDVIAGNAVLFTVSGGISAKGLRAYASVHSTSGAIAIQRAEGKGEFKTVSGGIDVLFDTATGDISAKSTSGRVRIGLPRDLSYYLDASSVSGSIQTPGGETLEGGKRSRVGSIGKAPRIAVRLSTISGRIELAAN